MAGTKRKSKRQLIRDEKRAKEKKAELGEDETKRESKRQRTSKTEEQDGGEDALFANDTGAAPYNAAPETEFFGMLADEEQEYFKQADELLELNDFPSPEDRDMFLQNVYKEAEGKELKLASSQSCSRLMERLIMLSNTRQKKHLFEQYAGHFISLITHRFASHCVEKLFLVSAPVVTEEMSGVKEEEPDIFAATEEKSEEEQKPQASMEELFLLTLDELEEHLAFLLSEKFASHALRVLLVILSGRPLDQAETKSLLQSKAKEQITVAGGLAAVSELMSQNRVVPETFTLSIKKIIHDCTSTMDTTALRVLSKHPTGNPVLQLLLELDIQLNTKVKSKLAKQPKAEDAEEQPQDEDVSLLERLVPGAPASFSDASSPASEFVNSMLYDPIGSRLLETLITHCPGKIFKGLQANYFGPRIDSLLRNDIASYPAIRVLNRMNKEDLAEAVKKSIHQVPHFVEKRRCNVLKTLFERCQARGATEEADGLLEALVAACGGNPDALVPKLCDLDGELDEKKKGFQPDEIKNKSALIAHGAQLVIAMLGFPGAVSEAIQKSLLALSSNQLLKLATTNTSRILTAAFTTPSKLPALHKRLVAGLSPHAIELANSPAGQHVLNGIITAPSKGDGISIPFHLKENLMSKLAAHERDLRESWTGRNVWRTWKGDIWNHKRSEWIRWAKEADPEAARKATMPKPKGGGTWEEKAAKNARGAGFKGANNMPLGPKRKRDPAAEAA